MWHGIISGDDYNRWAFFDMKSGDFGEDLEFQIPYRI
jgi:hypothetical protein